MLLICAYLLRRRRLSMLLLLSVDTALAAPRGGKIFPRREGNEAQPSQRRLDVSNTVVEHEYIKRETNESACIDEIMEIMKEEEKKTPFPKRLFDVAKTFIGRAADVILSRSSLRLPNDDAGNDDDVDHTFDDLDRIIESTNTTKNDEVLQHRHQHLCDVDGGEEYVDGGWLLETFLPPLRQGSPLLSGRKQQRSLLHRMNKKLLSSETAKALNTIRGIIKRFPEYGIVDLFGMYSPKDVIWSFVALSKLQHIVDHDTEDDTQNDVLFDKKLLEELAHYCAFASAAYGWKGFAFCGRLHPFGGNYRVVARGTGIDKRDIVAANWHSKANRPAYYIARDIKRKAIVLSIRGSLSPRDILTDLICSCENFFVEDDVEIGGIVDVGSNATAPPPIILGRAHKGMVEAAQKIAGMTGKIISDELDANPDYTLVIVGHSLGGGVAAIIAAMWHRRFLNRIRAIGYGSPCVFPMNITKEFDNIIISIVGSGDPFARISLGHLADLTKAISKLCQDKGMRDEILRRTTDTVDADDFSWCANVMIFLRKLCNSEKLLPPGKIFQVSGPLLEVQQTMSAAGNNSMGKLMGRDITARLKSVDAIRFNELKLHARMFDVSLHIPLRYELLLQRLASSEI